MTTSDTHDAPYCFFLGGGDLEMQAIAELLATQGDTVSVVDRGLVWGAKASDYRREIEDAATRGAIPVLVELEPDIPLPETAIQIDHHNERAGRDRPTALEQVFELLGLPKEQWTRHFTLVAANDRGHIREMKSCGATPAEIQAIREADRRAQGVTPTQEAESREAIDQRTTACGGRLTVVCQPHDRSSPVTDTLDRDLGGPGYDTLVVAGPTTVNVFAPWPVIAALEQEFPGGWSGGAKPVEGFWGRKMAVTPVETFLRRFLQSQPPAAERAEDDSPTP